LALGSQDAARGTHKRSQIQVSECNT
jgi:hypothetical protein